ncbi:MAG TPA: maleylpyruvate isomerase N-terminal domain-containing protein [Candidatus Methylomirabilis sp.]
MGTSQAHEAAHLVAELDAAFAELKATVAGLDDAARGVVMQGRWTVKDILAHIAGWHREMTPALERLARGEKAIPDGANYNDFDAWNARFVEARRGMTPAQVEAELHESFAAFRAALLAVPEARRQPGRTAGKIAQDAGFEHYRHHASQIRRWREGTGR